MKNIVRALAIMSVVCTMVPVAFAGSNPKCPACKMELSSKKDKKHSVAVKIKGKTYYCCAGCAMNKKPSKDKPQKSK